MKKQILTTVILAIFFLNGEVFAGNLMMKRGINNNASSKTSELQMQKSDSAKTMNTNMKMNKGVMMGRMTNSNMTMQCDSAQRMKMMAMHMQMMEKAGMMKGMTKTQKKAMVKKQMTMMKSMMNNPMMKQKMKQMMGQMKEMNHGNMAMMMNKQKAMMSQMMDSPMMKEKMQQMIEQMPAMKGMNSSERMKKMKQMMMQMMTMRMQMMNQMGKPDKMMNKSSEQMHHHMNMNKSMKGSSQRSMQMNKMGKKGNVSTMKKAEASIVRKGIINVEQIDQNKDGYLYQDIMDWEVISDSPGTCPKCGMKLRKMTIAQVKENLKKHGFKYK